MENGKWRTENGPKKFEYLISKHEKNKKLRSLHLRVSAVKTQ